jgi:hypothetical protein
VSHRQVVVLLCSCWLLAACGDSSTGPSSGRVDAIIQDSPTRTPAATGTFSGNVFVSLWNGSRWIDLGSPNGITFPIQITGRTTTVHGEQTVGDGSYSRVRLVFEGVTARLAAGSVVGDTTLSSAATVTLGGTDQRVEIAVTVTTFSVESDSSMKRTVTFDLRSQSWLTASAIQTGRVEDDPLQAAVTASTRLEPR